MLELLFPYSFPMLVSATTWAIHPRLCKFGSVKEIDRGSLVKVEKRLPYSVRAGEMKDCHFVFHIHRDDKASPAAPQAASQLTVPLLRRDTPPSPRRTGLHNQRYILPRPSTALLPAVSRRAQADMSAYGLRT